MEQTKAEPALIDLETLLERMALRARGQQHVSVGMMLEAAGRRSFGALLLVLGIIPASPLSGVPGLPSVIAVLVSLVAVQLLVGRDSFWLPGWLLDRHVSCSKFERALGFLQPIARTIDRFIQPRLTMFTHNAAMYLIAALSVAVAVTMPLLEIVPFANTTNGIALSAFGLALIAHDGVLALVALAFCAIGFYLVFSAMPFF